MTDTNAITGMSSTRLDDQIRRRTIERMIYPNPYASGADAYLVVSKGNRTIIDVIAFEFVIVEPILSIAAYYDYTRTSKAYGQRKIQGSITINATKPGYLIELINSDIIPITNVSEGDLLETSADLATYSKTLTESGNTLAVELWGEAPWAGQGVSKNLRPAMSPLSKVGPINPNSSTDLVLVYILGNTRRYYKLIDIDLSILKHEFDLSGKPVLETYQFEATDIDMNLTMHEVSKTEASVTEETIEQATEPNPPPNVQKPNVKPGTTEGTTEGATEGTTEGATNAAAAVQEAVDDSNPINPTGIPMQTLYNTIDTWVQMMKDRGRTAGSRSNWETCTNTRLRSCYDDLTPQDQHLLYRHYQQAW